MSAPRSARDVAARTLVRVMRDNAFAAAALEAELGRAVQLDERERAFATELAYGTLRVLPWIEKQLDARARKPTHALPWEARAAMWIAVHQLLFLRVPAFAAVDEAVTAVRRAADAKVGGFANAVLRKIAKERPEQDDAVLALRARAALQSLPSELRDALVRTLGETDAARFASDTDAPPLGLRVRDPAQRARLIEQLARARPSASFREGTISPWCILGRGTGKPQDLPGYAEGDISVQEEGSQLVALAVGALPSEIVLDACAGRGNKTSVLALLGATVDACDRDPRKLAVLETDLARQHLRARATFAVDWTVGSGDVTGEYDAVLVDAPCSGTGTLRRRPELLLRERTPLAERTRMQSELLRRTAVHVKPGGRLIYAVCSILREEAEDVIATLGPEFEPAPFASEVARHLAGDAATLRLVPYVHGTDGYFLASLRKRP